MSVFIASINSGSNGNCYYVGNDSEAVLIDAGISCRETERRMARLGLSMDKVKAIFVSHEHTDHITGIPVLSRKYALPVYITHSTLQASRISVAPQLVHSFDAGQAITIGNLQVYAFRKSHDACDPHSFMVSHQHTNIGIFTDIGVACDEVTNYFSQCHAAFLEANYCEDMLLNGDYPWHLKKRIHGDTGHLSNTQALQLFISHRGKQLSHLILSHLSKNNNRPELVDQLFREVAGSATVMVASRYEESPVFRIEPGEPVAVPVKHFRRPGAAGQLSLF